MAIVLTIVALMPVLVVLVSRWGRDYLPLQDSAVFDLRLRDVWSSDIPLTGAYSRYGWSHPGPWMYWLLAPFTFVTGRAPWATLVGAALLQGVAVVWIARLAWRAGGLGLLTLWLAITMLAAVALGSSAWLEVWNPYLAVPFFSLFLLQAWLAWRGDARRLVGASIVGSFVVQTHVGYAVLVAAVLAGAVIVVVVDARRAGRDVLSLPSVRWSGLALVVLWLPVVVETLIHRPGNLGEVLRFFTRGGAGEPVVGPGDGAGLLATAFAPRPTWLGGSDQVDAITRAVSPAAAIWLVIPVVVVLAAVGTAWRIGDRADRRSALLLATVVVAAWVTLARVSGTPFAYLFHWRSVVGPFVVLAGAWTVLRSARVLQDRPAVRAAWCVALGVVVVVASIDVAAGVASRPASVTPYEDVARAFVDELAEQGQPSQPVLVRFVGSALGGVHAALVDELDRRGAPVLVDDGPPYAFGRARTATADDVDELWYVVEDGHALSLLTERPGATVLVRTSPLSPDDEAELVELQRTIAHQLADQGRDSAIDVLGTTRVAETLGDVAHLDPDDLRRVDELNAEVLATDTCRCAVISFPASQPPQ